MRAGRELVDEMVRSGLLEGLSDDDQRRALSEAIRSVREASYESPEDRQRALRRAQRDAQRLDNVPGRAPEHVVWRDNLEADNFSHHELCAVLNSIADDEGLDQWGISGDELSQRIAGDQEGRGVAAILLELAGSNDPPLSVSKPDYARRLARFAVDHPTRDGDDRPLLVLAEHLVRLTIANRRARGELRSS